MEPVYIGARRADSPSARKLWARMFYVGAGLKYRQARMRQWQLYPDESGDFESPREAVLIAGVLFEGRATPQLSIGVRRRLQEIFVGSAYPPHAVHHNLRALLPVGAFRGCRCGGRRARAVRAAELHRALAAAQGDSEPARELRAAVLATTPGRWPDYEAVKD
ncbi:MAG: hypothetical protein R3B70_29415 [Polyangiaceae bacterium]